MPTLIDDITQEFFGFKPRFLCICGNYEPYRGDFNILWVSCKNCGGWRFWNGDQEIVDKAIKRNLDGSWDDKLKD